VANPKANELVVYTCITGQYDEIRQPIENGSDIRFICYSDARPAKLGLWEIRPVPKEWGSGAQANRFAKMHPHILFPEYEQSLYIDGNIEVVSAVGAFVQSALEDALIAAHRHPFRNCVYEEAIECSAIGYGWPWQIQRQLTRYAEAGYPRNAGLFECNIIARRHLNPKVIALMEAWWEEYCSGIRRDQLSLPFLAWMHGLQINNLGDSDARFTQKFFKLHLDHRRPNSKITKSRGFLNRVAARIDILGK
jgi:hypothetical protein